ncbi:thioredoxin family protein [Flavobacterium granuli]|uniref:Thioredoxin-like n=1 Tax=Flavobacterium granuli TaxID=280093 RepID=A0A1M5NUH0_9FLAO|nr:thioredoxin family protein [Flavobacterium granuli]PRZ23404.1 thioredoxin-like protein [Flavobacterium granuli]SHG93236.1 Thioredoxin-like [Flavobacterium granuli]
MKNKITFLLLFITAMGYSQVWNTNFNLAKEDSLSKNIPILLVFSGSDWCAPCIKLDTNIWQSAEFKAYAAEKLILVRADFPKKKQNQLQDQIKKQNQDLAEIYNKEGIFPLVLLLDNTGKILGATSYKNVPPKEYISLLNSFIKP